MKLPLTDCINMRLLTGKGYRMIQQKARFYQLTQGIPHFNRYILFFRIQLAEICSVKYIESRFGRQTIKPLNMKMQFAPDSTAVNAGRETTEFKYALKEIDLPSFSRLIFATDAGLQLLDEQEEQKIFIEGDEELVNQIEWKQEGRTLTIKGCEGQSYAGLLQITLAVKELATIAITALEEKRATTYKRYESAPVLF